MFKVGDKVRNVRDYDRSIPKGLETVVKAYKSGQIRFEDADGDDRWRWPHDYELVQPVAAPSGFNVGDTVIRHTGRNGKSVVGHIATIEQITPSSKPDDRWLTFTDGCDGYESSFTLVPPSPVRTETITRSVIVPGVYGRLFVMTEGGGNPFIAIENPAGALNADELDAAALVLTQLAAAVRDAD